MAVPLGHHRLSLDQVYDVQHHTYSDDRFSWWSPSRIHTDAGRKDMARYRERKHARCYLAFYSREDDSKFSLGCFSESGQLVEQLYDDCTFRLLHDNFLFFGGDGGGGTRWGNVILPPGLGGFGEMRRTIRHKTHAYEDEEIHADCERLTLGARPDGSAGDAARLLIRSWLRKNRAYHPWRLVRNHVKARGILFFWVKVTLERTMAEGGAQRQRDLEAFERDVRPRLE